MRPLDKGDSPYTEIRQYQDAVPKVNEDYLRTVSEEILERAKAIFEELALDYRPDASLEVLKRKNIKIQKFGKASLLILLIRQKAMDSFLSG